MATYKVPQDVEAEDKFLGPLTFKQFLFAGGAAITGYIMFVSVTKSWWVLVILVFPFFVICGFLGFPWTKDQPTELWLAAQIRFLIMPRKRIWDQTGMKDLVSITVPKREVKVYTDGLNQTQVKTRLDALANIVDSRGWAIKNHTTQQAQDESDRLVVAPQKNQSLRESIVNQSVDIMDEKTNPLAQQFDSLIQKASDERKQHALETVKEALEHDKPQTMADDIAIDQGPPLTTQSGVQQTSDPILSQLKDPARQPAPSIMGMGTPTSQLTGDDEQKLLDKIHRQKKTEKAIEEHSHLKRIKPLEEQLESSRAQQQATKPQAPSAPPVNPAIISLADNNDLTVETIARNIHKNDQSSDEVVISLH